MRQLIPAATMSARTTEEYGAVDVELATILPMAWPAVRRTDGTGSRLENAVAFIPRGVLIGIAAGIKLTPLAFGLIFLMGKNFKAILAMGVTFAATVGLGFLVLYQDSIQFWTSREKVGSSHVKIIENVMAHGGCAAVQGIFIRSETEGKNIPQIRHTDFTIRGNVYFGASKNGLSMSSIDGAVAENNVVIASPYSETGVSRADAQKKDPRCSGALKPALLSRFGTTSHMIRNNIVSQLGTSDGSQSNNITVSTTGTTVWTEV